MHKSSIVIVPFALALYACASAAPDDRPSRGADIAVASAGLQYSTILKSGAYVTTPKDSPTAAGYAYGCPGTGGMQNAESVGSFSYNWVRNQYRWTQDYAPLTGQPWDGLSCSGWFEWRTDYTTRNDLLGIWARPPSQWTMNGQLVPYYQSYWLNAVDGECHWRSSPGLGYPTGGSGNRYLAAFRLYPLAVNGAYNNVVTVASIQDPGGCSFTLQGGFRVQ